MSTPSYEIGVVYKKNSRFYLAVNDRELVSFKNQELIEVRPYIKYDVVRHMTVDDLCKCWEITTQILDRGSKPYFSPSADGIKPRVGGARASRSQEDTSWKVYRTIRMAG